MVVKADTHRLTCAITAVLIVIAQLAAADTRNAPPFREVPFHYLAGNPLGFSVLERPTPPSRVGTAVAEFEFPDEGSRDRSVHLGSLVVIPLAKPKGNVAKSSWAFFYVRQEDNNAAFLDGGEESPRRMT